MSIFGVSTANFFGNRDYVESLDLGVQDYGKQELEKKQQEISGRMAGTPSQTNNTLIYVLIGVGVAGLITLFVLKKKKII